MGNELEVRGKHLRRLKICTKGEYSYKVLKNSNLAMKYSLALELRGSAEGANAIAGPIEEERSENV